MWTCQHVRQHILENTIYGPKVTILYQKWAVVQNKTSAVSFQKKIHGAISTANNKMNKIL